ncbi:uncharacterized protein LOC142572931 isoform X2 [Dermacentor variabilis]
MDDSRGKAAFPRPSSQSSTILSAGSVNDGVLASVVLVGKLHHGDAATWPMADPILYCSRLSRRFSLYLRGKVLDQKQPSFTRVSSVTVHDRRGTAAGQHISPWPTSETWRDAICLEELTRPPGFPWLCSRMHPMPPLPRTATQRSHRVQPRYKDEASRSSAKEATVENAQASVDTALHGHGAPRIRSA